MKENSIPSMFITRAKSHSLRIMEHFKKEGIWRVATYDDVMRDVLAIASALIELGLSRDEKVGIISDVRREWVHADLASQMIGCQIVPMYPIATKEQISYIADNSKLSFVFAQNLKQLQKIERKVKGAILFEAQDKLSEGCLSFSEFLQIGMKNLRKNYQRITKEMKSLSEDDVATIVYTSGTTGVPKGVVQTHGNILSMLWGISKVIPLKNDDIVFLWLPLVHTFGRMAEFYTIYSGCSMAYCESIGKLLENMKEVKPTAFPSVPRIYEKAYDRIISEIEKKGLIGKLILRGIKTVGYKVAQMEAEKEIVPLHLKLAYGALDRIFFSKVKESFGGRIRLCISGGAPLSPNIARFFDAVGITILEGYGLTETCPVVSVNRPGKYKYGTVGLPLPNVKFKIADDGEIFIKAPNVAKGYLNNPEETSAIFTEDGWLKTGDIGYIDEDGFLVITGRKKDIIVNSFGKNIASTPIETTICEEPLISSCALFGDGKPYITALISLSKDEVLKFARERGIKGSFEELTEHPEITSRVKEKIKEVNSKLATWEAIRNFKIVKDEWSPETGELTPTLKVKKDVVFKKYRELIESMYR